MIQQLTYANVYKQIYDIVLNTSGVLLLLSLSISQSSALTRLRCGVKYDISLVANLLLSLRVKEFLKSANITQSYEWILNGTIFYGSRCIRSLYVFNLFAFGDRLPRYKHFSSNLGIFSLMFNLLLLVCVSWTIIGQPRNNVFIRRV